MKGSCPRAFDETLISGFLDDELTQAAEQKTRLHIEECAHCRDLLEELRTMREATMTTDFSVPDDDQWDERPRTVGSRFFRGAGWLVIVIWLAVVAVYGGWQLWTAAINPIERIIVFGGLSAVAMLFVSVLLDRLDAARTDRYREVER